MSISESARPAVPATLRGALYGRRPIGVGTPLLECLSGYLARLCEARSISVVDALDVLLRPLVPPKLLRSRHQLPRYLTAHIALNFDGMTWHADAAVVALQALTRETCLAVHTCLSWRGLFNRRSSGAVDGRRKRWCSLCFDAWDRDGSEPWEPLLFRLEPVRRCPIHRVRLSDRCPSCNRTQPLVTQRVPLSYCHHCGARLQVGDPLRESGRFDASGEGEAVWEWCISVVLGQMLSVQIDSKRLADPRGFASLIDREVERDAFGMNSLADALGLKRNMLRQWRRLIKRPWLRNFVNLCLRLGAHPADVAFPDPRGKRGFPWSPWPDQEALWLKASVHPAPSPHRRTRNTLLAREATALDGVVAAGGYASATAAAQSVGVSYYRLKRHFSEQCLKLHAGAAAYRAERVRQYREALCRAIDGRDPSCLEALARSLGVAPCALRNAFPDLCARLVEIRDERRRCERAERVKTARMFGGDSRRTQKVQARRAGQAARTFGGDSRRTQKVLEARRAGQAARTLWWRFATNAKGASAPSGSSSTHVWWRSATNAKGASAPSGSSSARR